VCMHVRVAWCGKCAGPHLLRRHRVAAPVIVVGSILRVAHDRALVHLPLRWHGVRRKIYAHHRRCRHPTSSQHWCSSSAAVGSKGITAAAVGLRVAPDPDLTPLGTSFVGACTQHVAQLSVVRQDTRAAAAAAASARLSHQRLKPPRSYAQLGTSDERRDDSGFSGRCRRGGASISTSTSASGQPALTWFTAAGRTTIAANIGDDGR
jgi:hypothetical protein